MTSGMGCAIWQLEHQSGHDKPRHLTRPSWKTATWRDRRSGPPWESLGAFLGVVLAAAMRLLAHTVRCHGQNAKPPNRQLDTLQPAKGRGRSRKRISVVKGAAGDRHCQSLFLFEACPSAPSREGCMVESSHGFPALPLDTNRLGH